MNKLRSKALILVLSFMLTMLFLAVGACNPSKESLILLNTPDFISESTNVTPNGTVHLEWNTVERATEYKIKRLPSNKNENFSGYYAEKEIALTPDSSYDDTDVVTGMHYFYTVTALNDTSMSNESPWYHLEIPPDTTEPLPDDPDSQVAPQLEWTNVPQTSICTNQPSFSWQATPAGTYTYIFQLAEAGDFTSPLIHENITLTNYSIQDPMTLPDGTYNVRIGYQASNGTTIFNPASEFEVALYSPKPKITTFTIDTPSPTDSPTLPITLVGTGNTCSTIEKYLVREDGLEPALSDFVAVTPPTEITVSSSPGTKTIYAWVLDSLGTISNVAYKSIEIKYPSLYVSNAGDDANSGKDPTHPLKTITEAFSRASADTSIEQIYVAKGIYNEVLLLDFDIKLIGGYSEDFGEYDWQTHITQITSSNGSGNTLTISTGVTQDTEIQGLHIYGSDSNSSPKQGMGVMITHANPVFKDSFIQGGNGNSADYSGRGMHIEDANVSIDTCTIQGGTTNSGTRSGTGIGIVNSSCTLTDLTIQGGSSNSGDGSGAGIISFYGAGSIKNSTISGGDSNTGDFSGSGILFNNEDSITIDNTTIQAGQDNADKTAGIYIYDAHPVLNSNTIQGNINLNEVYGVYIANETCANTKLDGNTIYAGTGEYATGIYTASMPAISNSIIYGGSASGRSDSHSIGIVIKDVPSSTNKIIDNEFHPGIAAGRDSLVSYIHVINASPTIENNSGSLPTSGASPIPNEWIGIRFEKESGTDDMKPIFEGNSLEIGQAKGNKGIDIRRLSNTIGDLDPAIQNNTITLDDAINEDSIGLYLHDSNPQLSLFRSNTIHAGGSTAGKSIGLKLEEYASNKVIIGPDNDIRSSTCNSKSIAIWVQDNSDLIIEGNTHIQSGVSSTGTNDSIGISLDSEANYRVRDNQFIHGGTSLTDDSYAIYSHATSYHTLIIERNHIYGGTADDVSAGIRLDNSDHELFARNNFIHGGEGSNQSIGINIDGTGADINRHELINNTIIGGDSPSETIGLYIEDGVHATIINNILMADASNGFCIFTASDSKPERLLFNFFYNAAVLYSHGGDTFTNSSSSPANTLDNSDLFMGTGFEDSLAPANVANNRAYDIPLSMNALFVDPSTHDYRLQALVLPVDAGIDTSSYGVTDDIDQTSRPLGMGYDIGYAESH